MHQRKLGDLAPHLSRHVFPSFSFWLHGEAARGRDEDAIEAG